MKQDPKKPIPQRPAPKPTPVDSRPAPKSVTPTPPVSRPPISKPAGTPVIKAGVPPVKPPAPPPMAKPASDVDGDNLAHQASFKPLMAAKPAEVLLAEHTVAEGQTLSDIALKYYKSAAREKWMKIYEANKALIGDKPSLIKPGMVLKIPKID